MDAHHRTTSSHGDIDYGADASNRAPNRAWLSDRWADPGDAASRSGGSSSRPASSSTTSSPGIPWSTNSVLLYVVAGLVVSSLGSGVRWKRLILDWLPLIAVLFGYVSGLSSATVYATVTFVGPFYSPQVWFDTHVFSVDPTAQLQRWLYTPGPALLGLPGVGLLHDPLLHVVHHRRGPVEDELPQFRRFVPLFVGLTFIGYITYVLYPAMPPWMASQFGHLPRHADHRPGLGAPPHRPGQSLFAGGNKFDNNVAAMPSLHGAYPMLICLFFWKGSSARKRVLLAAYPICMAFSLVYTAEHFVIDIFVGWIYAAAVFYFGSKLLDRWEARRRRKGLDSNGPWTSGIGEKPSSTVGGTTAGPSEPVFVGA